MTRRVPDGFLWGAATSAYQVEGAVDEDGRGVSIWDTFSHSPGAVDDGGTGDVACDHYHRYREDVGLLAELGLNAYRFSISWPRIVPDGDGAINSRGLDFYDRLVDELLAQGITPMPTLYHWDLPQALQDGGGWMERETVDAFVRYTEAVASRLGDRVKRWITHNEPWVASFWGHAVGLHAPGWRDWTAGLQTAHHLLLSHGRAVPVLRGLGAEEVGIALCVNPISPASDAPGDLAAAQRADRYANRWFFDPVFKGEYPDDFRELLAADGHQLRLASGDMEEIAAPVDFLGLNYYQDLVVEDAPDQPPLRYRTAPGGARTGLDWRINPPALRDVLVDIVERYAPAAIYITENGAAYDDPPPVDGAVHDPERVAYLRGHVEAALDALAAGVPLRGYFVWSLIDCFEWTVGYEKCFGIVHVDFETQRRTIKQSGRFMEQVARAGALP